MRGKNISLTSSPTRHTEHAGRMRKIQETRQSWKVSEAPGSGRGQIVRASTNYSCYKRVFG